MRAAVRALQGRERDNSFMRTTSSSSSIDSAVRLSFRPSDLVHGPALAVTPKRVAANVAGAGLPVTVLTYLALCKKTKKIIIEPTNQTRKQASPSRADIKGVLHVHVDYQISCPP